MGYKKASIYRFPPGDLANWFAMGNSFQLPPGKFYAPTPATNYPDSLYLNGGATHVGINWGEAINTYSQQTGLPVEKSMQFFASPLWIQGFRPNKPLPQWTDDEVDDFVRSKIGYPGVPNIMVWTREDYNGSWDWRPTQENAPRQLRRLLMGFGAKIDSMNGWLTNEYGGMFNYVIQFDQGFHAPLRDAFASPDTALAFLKQYEEGWTNYWTQQYWQYMDCCMLTYQMIGDTNAYEFLYRTLSRLALVKLGFQANEITRKRRTFTYYMAEGAQCGYSEVFKTNVDAGNIRTDGTTFPRWSYPAQVFQGCSEFLFADLRAGWADAIRHGTSKSLIRGGKTVYDQTQTPQYYQKGITYVYDPAGAGYDSDSLGYNNAQEDGARWYSMIYGWTGTTNWNYCRYRTVNGTYCDTAAAYISNRYLERKPWAFVFQGINGKKALLVYTSPDSDYITYQFDIGASSPFEINLAPNSPHLFLID